MMEFNYLVGAGRDQAAISGTYAIDYARHARRRWQTWPKNFWKSKPPETASAPRTGSRKYDVMPAELQVSLKAASKVPVDVDPVFSFPEKIR